MKKIIWVIGVLRRAVVGDLCFDNLCGSHLSESSDTYSQLKIKTPSFDSSIDRIAIGKRVMRLAVKTCAEIGM